jgi:ABC-type antimicrobial peptide transport system permease subunit
VRESVALVSVGLAVGILVALLATRPLAGVLVNVQPGDPLTLVGVAAVLAIAAVLASLIPARRAATVDPLVALRQQ